MLITGETIVKRNVASNGAIGFAGSSVCAVKYTAQTSGSLTIGGNSLFHGVNAFFHSAEGTMHLSGVSHINYQALGFLEIDFSSADSVELTPVYPTNADAGQPVLTPDTGVVTLSCSPSPIPLLLLMQHNLTKAEGLRQFLSQNGFNLSKTINLVYNSNDNTWRFNQEWVDSNESWRLVVEIACVNTIAGSPVD